MYFWNPTAFQLECSKMPTASELPAASGRSANLSAWLHEGRRVLPFVIAACRGVWWVIRNLKHCRGNPCDHGTFHPAFTEGPIQTRSNWNPETWKALRPWLGINSSLKNSQFSESLFNSFASWCDLFFFLAASIISRDENTHWIFQNTVTRCHFGSPHKFRSVP